MSIKEQAWAFVFSSISSYRLLRYVAELAASEGRKVLFLYTGSDSGFFAEVHAEAKRLGFDASSIEAELSSIDVKLRLPPRPAIDRGRSVLFRCAMMLSERPDQAAAFRSAYEKRQHAAHLLLKRLCVSIVVCSEDGVSGDLALLSVAKQLKLPVVDIPYGNGTIHELEFDLSRKSDEGRLIIAKGLSLLVLKVLAPQWLKSGNFKNALMFTPEMIFAWESLGMSLRDSWVIHGGNSDLICVENDMSHSQYLSEGISPEKLTRTGSPYCDMMVDFPRKKNNVTVSLANKSRTEKARTRVLVSWPPSYHETYPGRSEFGTYDEMTLAILSHVHNLPGVDLSVSLHPACKSSTKYLIEKVGISVSDQYLLDLIPDTDVFITYFSSTIRWALAAGKVVLNYDAYGIGIKSFDSAPGFINVSKFSDFCTKIDLIVNLEHFFVDVQEKQVANASAWGILDGKCTKRIFSEMEMLLLKNR